VFPSIDILTRVVPVRLTEHYNYNILQRGLVVRPLQTNRWRITLLRRINTESHRCKKNVPEKIKTLKNVKT